MFSKIVKLAVNVAVLPIELVRDVVTLGGISTGRDTSYTVSRVEKIEDTVDEL